MNPPANAATSNATMAVVAIAAGNACIIRAPRSTPYGVAWLWHEIVMPALAEAGAPAELANLVCGNPGPLLDLWAEDPRVNTVMYFGSSERGLAYGAQCYAIGTKTVLELAGNDPVIVWKDADLERAADAACESFLGSTQICMVPKHVIVHADVADRFCELLTERANAIRPALPDSRDSVLSPVTRTAEYERVLAGALDEGATLLCGGNRVDHTGAAHPHGLFCEPTVVRLEGLELARSSEAVRTETFFPLLPVVVAHPTQGDEALFEDILDFVESNAYGLRNSLWCNDPELVAYFADTVRNGGLIKVNESHVGFVPGLPTHGGTGVTTGPGGQANIPAIATTHLQGVSITAPLPCTATIDLRESEGVASR